MRGQFIPVHVQSLEYLIKNLVGRVDQGKHSARSSLALTHSPESFLSTVRVQSLLNPLINGSHH